MSHDDARAMVRRYGERQARREAALPIMLVSGLGLGAAALTLARRPAIRSGLATTAQDITDRVESLAHDAKARVEGAQSASLRFAQEPLAIAAVGLALGLAASAIWPPSETERRLLGPARRRLIHQASDLAGEAVDQLRDTLQDALAAVTPEDAKTAEGAAQAKASGEPITRPRPRKSATSSKATGSTQPPEV